MLFNQLLCISKKIRAPILPPQIGTLLCEGQASLLSICNVISNCQFLSATLTITARQRIMYTVIMRHYYVRAVGCRNFGKYLRYV